MVLRSILLEVSTVLRGLGSFVLGGAVGFEVQCLRGAKGGGDSAGDV